MIELTEMELSLIKKYELEILKEINKICRDNGINYSLAYGTLLGAIRHKGFIPWDDDIDIMMKRSDYNKFIRLADKKISDRFYIVTPKTNGYGMMFSKVMMRGTCYLEKSITTSKSPNGIFVDVFPLDRVSNFKNKRVKQYRRAKFINRIVVCREKYYFGQSGFRLFMYRLVRIFLMLIPKKTYLSLYNAVVLQYSKSNNHINYLMNFCSPYDIEKDTYTEDIFSEFINVDFEDMSAMIIKNYDYFLKNVYGNYMKLPPVNERKGHHYVSKIDFGKSMSE